MEGAAIVTGSEALDLAVRQALEPLPDRDGGIAVTISTASVPPAVAMLSSGDVLVGATSVRIGIHSSSSVVHRLGGAFTLLVPLGDRAARVECVEAVATVDGPVALVEGTITGIRPTAEPPWTLELRFGSTESDPARLDAYVDYWRQIRSWLAGSRSGPPVPPV